MTTIRSAILPMLRGNIPCERINFLFKEIEYIMVFTHISEMSTPELLDYKTQEMGFHYRHNSYQIYFD